MEYIWESTYKVKAFDVDSNNRIKVSSIFDYLQDAASIHAEHLKFGYDDLLPKNLFWVLSWAKIEFNDYPKFMDEIRIQTWGKMQYKLYSMRDFLLYNDQDEIICSATTGWLLLDLKTLRPKILPKIFPEVKFWDEKAALTDLPDKFPSADNLETVYSQKINYSDIDINQHVNNAKYIEFLLNCYHEEFHKNHYIKSLTVSFMSETKFGAELEFSKGKINGSYDHHYVEAINLGTQKIVLKALINWN